MPITITAEEFKANTKSRYFQRPVSLTRVDSYLEEYHQKKHVWRLDVSLVQLDSITYRLGQWTKGKTKVSVSGKTWYNHVRDAKGYISLLETQVAQALLENQHARTAHLNVAQMGQATNAAPTPNARMSGPSTGPAAALENRDAQSNRSLKTIFQGDHSSIGSETSRASFRKGDAAPDAVIPNGYLGAQAYDVATMFLNAGWGNNVTVDEVRDAIIDAAFNVTATRNRALFPAIAEGLKAMGYQDIFMRQHCTATNILDTLVGARPNRPMLVVVGGGADPRLHRLIIVRGHKFDALGAGTNTYYTATDGQRPESFVRFTGDGNYSQMDLAGNRTAERLLPTMGIIKIQT